MSYKEIIKNVHKEGRKLLLEPEAYEVCKEFDIPYPPTRLASDLNEGIQAAKEIGFPVVMKVVSPDIVHKSDVGGVVVNIDSEEKFRIKYEELMSNLRSKAPKAIIKGILVQKQMMGGTEVVIGGLRDKQFGPVVMFGLGGILVEVFKDVSFRLAPLNKEEAMRQIRETKAFKLLEGVRGQSPSDIDAVANLIVNAGELLVKIPEISEIDFNPVKAYENTCIVVDARIILNEVS